MTDKLKLFTVRLESGAKRTVVAPDWPAVAQLRFSGPPDPSMAPGDDAVLSVELAGDVDFLILREPAPEPPPEPVVGQVPLCKQGEGHASHPCGPAETPAPTYCACGKRVEHEGPCAAPTSPTAERWRCPKCFELPCECELSRPGLPLRDVRRG